MTEQLKQKLNDSAVLRWSVLALVAFTMLCGYFLTDVMSPLKPMLEKELLWDSLDYGFFTSAYGWFNVFLLMLIFGGIILDKMGVRFHRNGSLFVDGVRLRIEILCYFYYFPGRCNAFRIQDAGHTGCLGICYFWCRSRDCGYHCFEDYCESGLRVRKWRLAMGLEMATARIGTTLAMVLTVPLADFFGYTDEGRCIPYQYSRSDSVLSRHACV